MGKVVTWPMPLTERPFDRYTLSVNGVSVPVWAGRVREEINKPQGAGYTHMLNGRTEWCGFARFDFEDSAEVTITLRKPCAKAEILPAAYGIKPILNGPTLRFTMYEPQHITVLLDDSDEEVLHLFTHRPETDIPDAKDPNVIYFGPGEHWINHIDIKSGQTVYLDGGALVRAVLPAGAVGKQGGVLNLYGYGSNPVFNVQNAENVRICGRGILDGTLLPHPARNLIRLYNSKDVRVEGILLRNSPNWHMPIANCERVTVDGLVGLSGRLNSDGINCVSTSHAVIRNCFMRTHDDTYAVKTMTPGVPSTDILYENCIAWNDWGYAFGVTYETRADISNATWRNCHALYARHWPIGVHVSDSGTVSNILFEGISIHYPQTRIPKEMGQALVQIDNRRDVWGKDACTGHVRDITLRNIAVTGSPVPSIIIEGADAEHAIEGVTFEGIRIGDIPLRDIKNGAFAKVQHANNITVSP